MHYPLNMAMRPSRGVMASVLALHALAGLALFYALPQSAWRALAILAVLLSMVMALRQEQAKRGLGVLVAHDGGVVLTVAGRQYTARLQVGAVDFGWAVWLSLQASPGEKLPRGARRLMLVPANLPEGHWRPFRIWLRHCAPKMLNPAT